MAITLIRPSQINHVPVGANLIAVLALNNTETTVANTLTETQVYSFTIAANTMSVNDSILFELYGTYQNTSGGNETPHFRCKLGGTTILDGTVLVPTANNGGLLYKGVIKNQGATNSQKGMAFIDYVTVTSGAVGTAAIDMTVAQSLIFTIQHNVANAAISYIQQQALITFIPAT